jgi:hypothetical protein
MVLRVALLLSAVPGLTLNSKVKPMLIPEVKLGLEAFGLITADVLLDVEGSLSADLKISGDADTHTGTDGNTASGDIKGCVDIGAALSLQVSAKGAVLALGLSKTAKYALFSDNWDLYKQCASTSGSTKREASSGLTRRADLTCPTSSVITSIETIIDEIIKDIESTSS